MWTKCRRWRESKQVGVPTVNLLTHTPEEQLSPKVKAFLLRPKKLYINGQFLDAAQGETFETEDPALGTSINRISAAGAKDVERAAIAARQAFVGRAVYLCVLCG